MRLSTFGAVAVTITFAAAPLMAQVNLQVPDDITAEATAANGAVVTYAVNGSTTGDDHNGRPTGTATVSCSPSSGSRFPLGVTTVNCTASDAYGSTSGSFRISVVDRTPPSLRLPESITISAPATVSYFIDVIDLVDAHPSLSCTPPSGSHFSSGTTTVLCTARDSSSNESTGSFTITVTSQPDPDPDPPQAQLPDDITAEATGPNGAVVTYQVSVTGGTRDADGRPSATIACTPPSGSTFPLGTTTVNCTMDGSPAGSFDVTVVDTTAPVLRLPRDMTVQTDGTEEVVTFDAAAEDAVSGTFAATCNPPSGSSFPLGETTVNCSSQDAAGNSATGSFVINVTTTPPPPPDATLPDDITAEATGADGAIVTYSTNGGDGDDFNGRPESSFDCAPASGSLFPLGTTTVSCSESGGGAFVGTFLVHVVDTTPPVLTVPGDISANATSSAGAEVKFEAYAEDLVDGTIVVSCTPPSGSTFPIGTTAVNCSAADSRGNTSSGGFNVTVNDVSDVLEITVSASPDVLWPPDKKMVAVTLTVTATNGATISAQIIDVTSNEDDSTDWEITGPLSLNLRSEKNDQAAQREYRVIVEATDEAGNKAYGSVLILVANPNTLTRPDDVQTHDPEDPTTQPRRGAAGPGRPGRLGGKT